MYVASVASFSGVNLLDVVCGNSCANRDIDVETASYLKFHETKRSYQRKIETKHETVLLFMGVGTHQAELVKWFL